MGRSDSDGAVATEWGSRQLGLSRVADWFAFLAIVLAAAALAPGVASDYFFSDATFYISENTALRTVPLSEFWRTWQTPLFWRELLPLRDLAYRVEMQAFGLEPIPYKVVNLILLVLCGLAVWAFVNDFQERYPVSQQDGAAPRVAAAVTLALWIAHPSHVESIAWAAGLKDVLSGVLGVVALYAFQRALPGQGEPQLPRLGPLALATLLFSAALMSKITVAPVAGMALLLAVAALSRSLPSWQALAKGALAALPLLAVAIVAVAIHVGFASSAALPSELTALDGRFERALRILGTMYQMSLLPYDLRLSWNVYEGGVLGTLRFAVAVFALLGAAWGAWAFAFRRVPEGFALAAALGATVPVLHLIPFDTWSFASERHLFWPFFGLALVAGSLAVRAISRDGRVLALTAVAVGVTVTAYLGLTLQRSLEWHAGPERLYFVENEADPSWGFGALLRIKYDLDSGRYDVAMRTAARVENEAQRNMLKALVSAAQAVERLSRDRGSRSALLTADRMMLEAEATVVAVRESASDPVTAWLARTMHRRLISPYEVLIKLAPEEVAFRYNLALIKMKDVRQDERHQAEILFLQAIRTERLAPSNKANAWRQIAVIRMRRNNFAGARLALSYAMAADAADYRAAYLLAVLETRSSNLEAASNAAQQYRIRATAAGLDPKEIEVNLKSIGDIKY